MSIVVLISALSHLFIEGGISLSNHVHNLCPVSAVAICIISALLHVYSQHPPIHLLLPSHTAMLFVAHRHGITIKKFQPIISCSCHHCISQTILLIAIQFKMGLFSSLCSSGTHFLDLHNPFFFFLPILLRHSTAFVRLLPSQWANELGLTRAIVISCNHVSP